jgi:hypothetical protein
VLELQHHLCVLWYSKPNGFDLKAGTYMAMTGAKITTPADALYLGLGTHYIPSSKLESLKLALLHGDLYVDQSSFLTSSLVYLCAHDVTLATGAGVDFCNVCTG